MWVIQYMKYCTDCCKEMNCVKKDTEFDLFYICNQYSGMQQVNKVLHCAVIVKPD